MVLLCHRSFAEFNLFILRVMKQPEEFFFFFLSFFPFPFHFPFSSPFPVWFFSPFLFVVFSFTEQMALTKLKTHKTHKTHKTQETWLLHGVDQAQYELVKVLGTSFEGRINADNTTVEKGQLAWKISGWWLLPLLQSLDLQTRIKHFTPFTTEMNHVEDSVV